MTTANRIVAAPARRRVVPDPGENFTVSRVRALLTSTGHVLSAGAGKALAAPLNVTIGV